MKASLPPFCLCQNRRSERVSQGPALPHSAARIARALNLRTCDQKGHDRVTAPPRLPRPFTANGHVHRTRPRRLLLTAAGRSGRGGALSNEGRRRWEDGGRARPGVPEAGLLSPTLLPTGAQPASGKGGPASARMPPPLTIRRRPGRSRERRQQRFRRGSGLSDLADTSHPRPLAPPSLLPAPWARPPRALGSSTGCDSCELGT